MSRMNEMSCIFHHIRVKLCHNYALNGNKVLLCKLRKVPLFFLTLFFTFTLSFIAQGKAYAQSDVKVVKDTQGLKTYLTSLPVTDQPVKVKMDNNNLSFQKSIPETIKSAGKYVILDLSDTPIKTIPNNAFEKCDKLSGIIIPNSVTSIGKSAFEGCAGFSSITIPASVTSIGDGAFKNCKNLLTITLSNNITSIGKSAFEGCSSLISITIPDSITDIEISLFDRCTSLTSITIPAGVTTIKRYAFSNCSSLTSVTFSGTVPFSIFDSAAFGESSGYIGDLRAKYLAGGKGTYTRTSGSTTWTKK